MLMPAMKLIRVVMAGAIVALLGMDGSLLAKTIRFSGYDWSIRPSGFGGPGPNNWDEDNVWVEGDGSLHLRLSRRNDKWYGAEVLTKDRLGFGRYQFHLLGRVDALDPNVVVGLFNYPTADVGPDGTNEIDIEFARWGSPEKPAGNFSVAPSRTGLKGTTKGFPISLQGNDSTHEFTWTTTGVRFQSFQGPADGNRSQISSWLFQASDSASYVPQKPMPVHINLWCFRGQPPKNGQPVELVVRSFTFDPR